MASAIRQEEHQCLESELPLLLECHLLADVFSSGSGLWTAMDPCALVALCLLLLELAPTIVRLCCPLFAPPVLLIAASCGSASRSIMIGASIPVAAFVAASAATSVFSAGAVVDSAVTTGTCTATAPNIVDGLLVAA